MRKITCSDLEELIYNLMCSIKYLADKNNLPHHAIAIDFYHIMTADFLNKEGE